MTSYQRIAVLVLRLLGSLWTLFITFVWGLYLVEAAFGVEVQHYPAHTVIGNLGYIVLGLLVVAISKPLGRAVGRGLD
ncbi:hypothetical protein [Luteibacter aegosomatissinici]|uniref:hypothetical protein n=1 Tax=Luteibacter aegosomatissinici TaxID=2911539 RepID=UPI001FFAE185|nr:hypothetical protein [Luteibacter aegosomatissinici]UPG95289.1 hypothetical protein L2Y97_04015 [Luteibacter aegosomatissinici]